MKKDAEQLQAYLQRAEDGERIEGKLAPLVQTATLVSSLAEQPPPPPNQLLSGRQRFLTEAARIRASKATPLRRVWWQPAGMRLAGALVAVVLVLGLIFGAGYAAADSLPGEPLYALKLATEAARLQWTADPEARAGLTLTLMAERLDEITRLIEQRRVVDEPIANRAREQLAQAFLAVQQVEGEAAVLASQRLGNILQVREQTLKQAASTLPQAEQTPVLKLLQEMNRVRQELHTGQGEPNQEQPRLRPETPTGQPGAGTQREDKPWGPTPSMEPDQRPGPQRDDGPAESGPKRDPHPGSGPNEEERPVRPQQSPAGPQQPDEPHPAGTPGSGPGSQPDEDPGSGPGPRPDSDPGSGPGSQPDEDPGSGPGSQSGEDPGSGPGSQPDEDPGSGPGSQPGEDPGSGSGSQPDQEPDSGSGSQPGGDQDSGPGSQPAGDSEPPGGSGSQAATGTGTDTGNGRP
ncbi:MAG: DUF5667 domain-containing protein [Anaerolineae bacterium]|jgi:hypothetical protein